MVSVTAKRGKVIVRLEDHQCSLDAEEASKLGLKLLDCAKKAAKRAGQFQEA